jgi:GWxTD domain-containing protein
MFSGSALKGTFMRLRYLALLLGLGFATLPAGAQKISVKDLPQRHQSWLREEVVYIISPRERDVFLQLSNDRERDMFITAFWKARDEDPNTPENKFKEEHYRRIEYANKNFGRGLKAGGWRSDMGRIYIALGEPKQIEKYENLSNVYPMVVWFYSGLNNPSLPSSFNIVFFKYIEAGDYILYSPIRDGPQKLMPFYNGDMSSYTDAYTQLLKIEPLIAQVSMTLIPNEYILGMSPSIASDILVGQRIPQSTYDTIKDAYAAKLLKYRDIIDVEYTANYIESDALVQVYRNAFGQAFVHYLLEPSRLSLERVENLYRTTFNVNGIITDASGRTIYQFDRNIPVELRGEQFEKIKDRLVSYQDAFPLIEGEYKLSVLWKNTISKEFTSVEANLTIPPARALTLTPPILANRVVRNAAFATQVKPFTVGETQLVASPRNDFVAADVLALYSELGGLTEELRRNGSVLVTITRSDQVVASRTRPIGAGPEAFRVLEEFPLGNFPPDYYAANVSVLDGAKTAVLSARTEFYISLNQALPRSWIAYAPLPPAGDSAYTNLLGMQNLAAGNIGQARSLLEAAFRRSPNSVPYALDFCRVLFAAKDYEGVRAVAEPFYKDKQKYEFAQFLGESAQVLGLYAEAIGYYKDYLTSYGTNLNVLNAIGECYVKTGDLRGAQTAWKKSLELNTDQAELKAKLADIEAKLKEKK